MIEVSFFLLGLASFLASCKNSGVKPTVFEKPLVIEYVMNFYEPGKDQQIRTSISYKDKVWYYDSMAIESVSKIKETSDKTGTTQNLQLLYYRFSDLRTNSAYEYNGFSDTAKLLREYSYSDTAIQIINGWNFKFKRKWDYNGKPRVLSDTVIGGINYKRVKLIRGPQTDLNEAICYFRCDKDFKLFVFDSELSKMTGCPLVKVVNFQVSNKRVGISNEIVLIAETFTEAEKKVFHAWETYAKEHPKRK